MLGTVLAFSSCPLSAAASYRFQQSWLTFESHRCANLPIYFTLLDRASCRIALIAVRLSCFPHCNGIADERIYIFKVTFFSWAITIYFPANKIHHSRGSLHLMTNPLMLFKLHWLRGSVLVQLWLSVLVLVIRSSPSGLSVGTNYKK